MFPPVFPLVDASAACRALLRAANGPTRFYQFGMAPQNVTKPYAVWQRVYGTPENYLAGRPDMDGFTLQIDVYAASADSARTVAAAIRDAIELDSYITNWLGESIDPDTKNYRFSFQNDWFVSR